MKSLIRWSAVLGLVSSTFLASSLTPTMRALALSEQQIMEKLRPVPVFTITDAQGSPLIANVPNEGKQTPVAGVFISMQDAEAFINELKKNNPQLAQQVKVVPVSLAEVYKMDQDNKSKAEQLAFAYVPMKQQVDSALALLRQQGQQISEFNGVPMFIATGGADKGYLTIKQGNEQVIPVFFNKEDLQGLITRFGQQQPELLNQVEIKVVDLQGIIETMQKSNDPQLNQLVLIPPRDSINFIRSLMPAGQPPAQLPAGQQPPATPR
ncbi:MAG TPA: Tic22 family protein [Halomicronema sp.]